MRCFFFRVPDQNVGKGEIQKLTGFNQVSSHRLECFAASEESDCNSTISAPNIEPECRPGL